MIYRTLRFMRWSRRLAGVLGLSLLGSALAVAQVAIAPLANPNPNNFDTADIMNAIRHPHSDLYTVAAHRGVHALAGTNQAPGVPENSLQAIAYAAQQGWESIEIDVKLTQDGVPILSHDKTWGRETCYNPDGYNGEPFNPFVSATDPSNVGKDPAVNSLTLEQLRTPAYSPYLRDTVSLITSNSQSCTTSVTPAAAFPPTLQEVYDYIRNNNIQMVVTLDIQAVDIAKAAWNVVQQETDAEGRPAYQSTIFKIPAVLFPTPIDFVNDFGANYTLVNFNPVFHTSGIAPVTSDPPTSFGSEQAMIAWIQAFESYNITGPIDIVAIEVSMKDPVGTPDGGILSTVLPVAQTNTVTGLPMTISQFNPVGEYYPNGDTSQTPEFFSSKDGTCCQTLAEFLFNNPNNTGPVNPSLPYDHNDNRTSDSFLVSMGAQMITTDLPGTLASYLSAQGKRNISYMQSSNPPGPYSQPAEAVNPPGSDPLPPLTVGETGTRRPDPSAIQVNGIYYSVEADDDNTYGTIYLRSASTLMGLASSTPVPIYTDYAGLGEVWAPEIMYINNTFYVYFSMGAGSAHRMYVISSAQPDFNYTVAQQIALPGNNWAIDGTTMVFNGQRYFVWSGWPGSTNGEQDLFIVAMSDPITPTGPSYVISRPTQPWELAVGNPNVNEGPEAILDPNGQLHIVYSTNGSWSSQYCLGDLRLRSGGNPTNINDWFKSNGCLLGSNPATMEQGWSPILNAQGPGHHTFALVNGDINSTPAAEQSYGFMYAAVPSGLTYSWANRVRYIGQYTWWPNIPYYSSTQSTNTGWSLGFSENPNASTPMPPATPGPPSYAIPPNGIPGSTGIQGADPSVIRVGSTYISVETDGNNIYVRTATSWQSLGQSARVAVLSTSGGNQIWAPEIQYLNGVYYIYYSALVSPSDSTSRRMFWVTITDISGDGTGQIYSGQLNLPGNAWATDGNMFIYKGQYYFVWSGWPDPTNVEQDLYITPMSGPITPGSTAYIISQPREPWELRVGNPAVNEAPAAIIDPNGQLHIDYSANGSWSGEYCIADLRLRVNGNPTNVWDWYKSNGCLFGSDRASMMAEWDPTVYVNGPGSHSFVLLNGDINTSPPAGQAFPLMYHAVPKGTDYTWANRQWFAGSFMWWNNTTYTRINSPGAASDTGYSIKYFEDPNYGTANAAPAPPPPPPPPGATGIVNADPSVIRVVNADGSSTYISVETDGNYVYARQAASAASLGSSQRVQLFGNEGNIFEIWAPKVEYIDGLYYVYFSGLTDSTDSTSRRMFWASLTSMDGTGFSNMGQLGLPNNNWATDGSSFVFNGQRYFVWSGWPGSTNLEQDLYIVPMSDPKTITQVCSPVLGACGPSAASVISQPNQSWELTVGNPNINEAPEAIIDPNGQLHITYSTNGSWSDQYCLADLRLQSGADPTVQNNWSKSNGCLFGSNYGNMMIGWDQTLYVNGPGSHSFVLLNGDISTSPPAGPTFPLMYHAVPKDTQYSWANRQWYAGTFCWWGNATYIHQSDTNTDTGWSLKFFENPNPQN